jgi:hypothetical protein
MSAVIVGFLTPLGALSGIGYLALARSADLWQSLLDQLTASDSPSHGDVAPRGSHQ